MSKKTLIFGCLLFSFFNLFSVDEMKLQSASWISKLCSIRSMIISFFENYQLENKLDPLELNTACKWNTEADKIEQLLNSNGDIHAKDQRGMTALHWAASRGPIEVCRLLLMHGANPNEIDNNGQTPLHRAAEHGKREIACLLIEKNAKIDYQDLNGYTPLHYAATREQEETVKLFVEKKACLNLPETKNKYTPLHIALEKDNANIVRILLKGGADVTVADIYEKRPLHIAAKRGSIECLFLLLIEKACIINTSDERGLTPLHYAIKGNHEESIQLLLKYDADINAQDNMGNTPLLIGAKQFSLLEILLKNGSNVHLSNNVGVTPLHEVMKCDDLEHLKLLLTYNARLDAKNISGKTPVHKAASCKNDKALRFLIEGYMFPAGWQMRSKSGIKNKKIPTLFDTCCLQIARAPEILFGNDVLFFELPILYKYVAQETPFDKQQQLIKEKKIDTQRLIDSHCQRHLYLLQQIFCIEDERKQTVKDVAFKKNKIIFNLVEAIMNAKTFHELDSTLAVKIRENIKQNICG